MCERDRSTHPVARELGDPFQHEPESRILFVLTVVNRRRVDRDVFRLVVDFHNTVPLFGLETRRGNVALACDKSGFREDKRKALPVESHNVDEDRTVEDFGRKRQEPLFPFLFPVLRRKRQDRGAVRKRDLARRVRHVDKMALVEIETPGDRGPVERVDVSLIGECTSLDRTCRHALESLEVASSCNGSRCNRPCGFPQTRTKIKKRGQSGVPGLVCTRRKKTKKQDRWMDA